MAQRGTVNVAEISVHFANVRTRRERRVLPCSHGEGDGKKQGYNTQGMSCPVNVESDLQNESICLKTKRIIPTMRYFVIPGD